MDTFLGNIFERKRENREYDRDRPILKIHLLRWNVCVESYKGSKDVTAAIKPSLQECMNYILKYIISIQNPNDCTDMMEDKKWWD